MIPLIASAARVPVGFADKEIARGLTSATAMTVMPDGRILVVQQNGVIRMIKNDTLLPNPFYTVANVDSFSERGCLGIVTDMNFSANGHVYIYCTVKEGATSHNRIIRVTASGDTALSATEQLILRLPNVPTGVKWHMGGALRFGNDGKLYVAVGGHEDERVADPVASFSQRLDSPFGKILRINPDGSFPSDNPFADQPGAYRGIYAIGLRNPFALDIQPDTGIMYINDVGANIWEEINRGKKGANYGWPAYEGSAPAGSGYDNPEYAYTHSMGCAITGGAFYDPASAQFPASYLHKYLFTDFCSGSLYLLDPANPTAVTEFVTDIGNPVNLGVAPDGSLYYLAHNQGTGTPTEGGATVGKIVYSGSQVPRIGTQPQSQTIFIGEPVTFSVAANGATGFQWQRNGTNIDGATGSSYTLPNVATADNQASFTVVVRNSFGTVTSMPAILTVTTNRPPVATINEPLATSGYVDNASISFSGSGMDVEDGALPESAYTWQIDLHHDTHSHPLRPAFSGVSSGTEVLGAVEANANTWLRFSLTVKDSAGQTGSAVRDVYPREQLSDMTPVGTPVNGLGPFEKNMTNGAEGQGDGTVISLDNIPYAKGLGVHAPSDLRYNLGGACSGSFIADVGVPDDESADGSVVFQVFADGVKLFDSGLVRAADARKAVKVAIAGRNELRLVVTDGGNGNTSDGAVWGGIRVTGCPVDIAGSTGGAAIAAPTGGGGCSIGGSGDFDPTLPALLLAALGITGWRRYKKRP